MDPKDIPLVGFVLEFGAQDRVLDAMLLAGPLVVLAMILGGRSPVTTALVGLYVLSFGGYVVYNGVVAR
ncbi:hypothetical protein C475_15744 [Halosimplex carlsbadense 2-9-1]|uniref:Uncharacterized protein n=1 Tax=Halosimplex carlsbadense 2-9-1 TaxID=797114 RepID=M0CIQ9_9EURY|nr:hypothetical protein [Halosimplex carlsbadense]ELZ23116.1 hypothetical protein C475_15744 [Halosimplex carlsbadense 2-9-1]